MPNELEERAMIHAADLRLRLSAKGITLSDDARTAINQAFLAFTQESGWMPIEQAPRDGTSILAWVVHPNAKYAEQGDDQWQGPVIARWIDHNGGGWTWHGHMGTFTHFRPLPAPPALDPHSLDRAGMAQEVDEDLTRKRT